MPRARFEQLLPELARRLATGESYPTIASALDISRSTVGRYARRQETKALVAQLSDRTSPPEVSAIQVLREIMVASEDEKLRAHCAELCIKYRVTALMPPEEPVPDQAVPTGYKVVVREQPIT